MELPEFSSSLEDIQARLGEQLAETQRSVQRAEVFTAQAQDLKTFVRSEGGEVSVEVGRGGVPLGMKVTAKTFSLTPEVFSRLILDIVCQAHCEAVQRHRDLARSSFGDSVTTEQPVSQARQQLRAYGRDAEEGRLGDSETGRSESGGIGAGTGEANASDGRSESPIS